MAVAAATKSWLPRFFSFIGHMGIKAAPDDDPDFTNDGSNSLKSSKSDAPFNALILSTILSILYVLFGNFRALLTFNGLGEYSFFFLTVFGAIILRFREPDLHRPYKPFLLIPIIFAVVSGFVVARGAIFAPVQTVILVILWAIGVVFYWPRRWWTRT
jgi:solute carrier family 7 (L-type amino acid transporter), member 9/15